jgi:hypothetical protein
VSRPVLRAAFLATLLAGLFGLAAPAGAADTPFSQRFAQTMRGSIEAVGNQLLTCPAATPGCLNARIRVGPAGSMNNNYNMGYVDVDTDGATFNSSSATLTLPAGATVTWAGLYDLSRQEARRQHQAPRLQAARKPGARGRDAQRPPEGTPVGAVRRAPSGSASAA